eukprot:7698275-Pyramimonas_sp.AAC.1
MLGPPGMRAGMALAEDIQEMVSDRQEADPTAVAASIDRAFGHSDGLPEAGGGQRRAQPGHSHRDDQDVQGQRELQGAQQQEHEPERGRAG